MYHNLHLIKFPNRQYCKPISRQNSQVALTLWLSATQSTEYRLQILWAWNAFVWYIIYNGHQILYKLFCVYYFTAYYNRIQHSSGHCSHPTISYMRLYHAIMLIMPNSLHIHGDSVITNHP